MYAVVLAGLIGKEQTLHVRQEKKEKLHPQSHLSDIGTFNKLK